MKRMLATLTLFFAFSSQTKAPTPAWLRRVASMFVSGSASKVSPEKAPTSKPPLMAIPETAGVAETGKIPSQELTLESISESSPSPTSCKKKPLSSPVLTEFSEISSETPPPSPLVSAPRPLPGTILVRPRRVISTLEIAAAPLLTPPAQEKLYERTAYNECQAFVVCMKNIFSSLAHASKLTTSISVNLENYGKIAEGLEDMFATCNKDNDPIIFLNEVVRIIRDENFYTETPPVLDYLESESFFIGAQEYKDRWAVTRKRINLASSEGSKKDSMAPLRQRIKSARIQCGAIFTKNTAQAAIKHLEDKPAAITLDASKYLMIDAWYKAATRFYSWCILPLAQALGMGQKETPIGDHGPNELLPLATPQVDNLVGIACAHCRNKVHFIDFSPKCACCKHDMIMPPVDRFLVACRWLHYLEVAVEINHFMIDQLESLLKRSPTVFVF